MTPMIQTKRLALWQMYLTRTIAALVCITAISIFLYCVFLMLAVEHAAARTALQTHVGDLTMRLSSQETQYLAAMKQLTPQYAATLGYVTPAQVTPVYADASRAPSLTLR